MQVPARNDLKRSSAGRLRSCSCLSQTTPVRLLVAPSKREAHSELDLTFRQCRSEAQGLTGRKASHSVHVEWWSKGSANDVVDSGEVCPVRDVESFCRKMQAAMFTKFERPAQANFECEVVGTETAVPRSTRGTIIDEVRETGILGSRHARRRVWRSESRCVKSCRAG